MFDGIPSHYDLAAERHFRRMLAIDNALYWTRTIAIYIGVLGGGFAVMEWSFFAIGWQ